MRVEIIDGITGNYDQEIEKLRRFLMEADAVIVGAGAGLSTSAGLDYSGERLRKYFGDFVEKYGMPDMYHGCFAPFESIEERWAYWSRWAWVNRFMEIPNDTLLKLKKLLEKARDYFVLTTNIDHSFRRIGFSKEKTCYTQGDLGLFQCSVPCHTDTYDDYDTVKAMMEAQGFVPNEKGLLDVPVNGKLSMTISTELIPHCSRCGAQMDFNLFWDERFIRDAGWHIAHQRYEDFLAAHEKGKVLYLELGVGYNSPGVIKYSFWQRTLQNPDALFASVNLSDPSYPAILADRCIVLSEDIRKVIQDLLSEQKA